jgi:type IX secretion system PorP/SprF family membrane protein
LIYTSFGASIGGSFLDINYNAGNILDSNDPLLNNTSGFDPSFGFGFMTYANNWFVGLAIPNFLKSSYFSTQESKIIDNQNLQYFILGGYIFDLNDNFKFKPAILARITENLPFVIDYLANILINEKLTFGISYRSLDIITGMFGIQLSHNFYLGYSYELTVIRLSCYNDGSNEIMLRFTIPKKTKTIQSPKFY